MFMSLIFTDLVGGPLMKLTSRLLDDVHAFSAHTRKLTYVRPRATQDRRR
jgi:hypothetical protein